MYVHYLLLLIFICTVPSSVGRPTVTQTAISGRPALRVYWRVPQSDVTITRYEVQYRVSISGSWATMRVTGASTLATTLTTLTPGRSYDVQVRAVSAVGSGAYSSVQTQFLNRGIILYVYTYCWYLCFVGLYAL